MFRLRFAARFAAAAPPPPSRLPLMLSLSYIFAARLIFRRFFAKSFHVAMMPAYLMPLRYYDDAAMRATLLMLYCRHAIIDAAAYDDAFIDAALHLRAAAFSLRCRYAAADVMSRSR